MGTPSPTKLVLSPYLQDWDGTKLKIRVMVVPRGSQNSPLEGTSGPSFANANLKLDVHIIAGDNLPVPGSAAFTSFPSPAPSTALEICNVLADQLPIHPSPPRATKPQNTQVI